MKVLAVMHNPAINESASVWAFALAVLSPAIFISAGYIDHFTLGLWVSSVLFLGLPHGASDWLLFRALWQKPNIPTSALFLSGYAFLAVSYYFFWQVFPTFSILTFILMTAWHWGSADSSQLRPNRLLWLCASLSRGGVIMTTPFLFFREECFQFLQTLGGRTEGLEAVSSISSIGLVVFGFLVVNLISWSIAAHRNCISAALLLTQVVELILLGFLFKVLPPLLSVGTYFLCIHSLRHSFRLAEILPKCAEKGRATGILGLHLHSFGCVIPIICLLLLWAWAYPADFGSIDQSIAKYLTVIAALTVPHAFFILYFDLRTSRANPG